MNPLAANLISHVKDINNGTAELVDRVISVLETDEPKPLDLLKTGHAISELRTFLDNLEKDMKAVNILRTTSTVG